MNSLELYKALKQITEFLENLDPALWNGNPFADFNYDKYLNVCNIGQKALKRGRIRNINNQKI